MLLSLLMDSTLYYNHSITILHFNGFIDLQCQGWKLNFDSTGHRASAFNKCNKKPRIFTCPSSFDTRLGKWASANFQPCNAFFYWFIKILLCLHLFISTKSDIIPLLLNKNHIKAVRKMIFHVVKKAMGIGPCQMELLRDIRLTFLLQWLGHQQGKQDCISLTSKPLSLILS